PYLDSVRHLKPQGARRALCAASDFFFYLPCRILTDLFQRANDVYNAALLPPAKSLSPVPRWMYDSSKGLVSNLHTPQRPLPRIGKRRRRVYLVSFCVTCGTWTLSTFAL